MAILLRLRCMECEKIWVREVSQEEHEREDFNLEAYGVSNTEHSSENTLVSYCDKHQHLFAEERQRTVVPRAENARLRAALEDFRDHGTRFDLQRTLGVGGRSFAELDSEGQAYVRCLDELVRQRAAKALGGE